MRLAVVTSKFPFDGREGFLYAEIAELARHAESLVIIPATPREKNHPYQNLRGNVLNIGPASLGALAATVAEFFRSPITVTRALWKVIINPRSRRAKLHNIQIFPKALAVAREIRQQRITHVHAYWLSTPSTIAYICSQLTDAEWSASGHRWDLVDTNLTSEPAARGGFMGAARFIRTISERGRRQVLFALGKERFPEVRVIHLGVKTKSLRANEPPTLSPFALVCIAGMSPVKGHSYLLRALAIARSKGLSVHCDLIGDGPLRASLEKLVYELNVETQVHFSGWVSLPEVHARLESGAYHAAILTSVDEGSRMCEGIPVSLMEAMARSIPCIATNSGSVKELINDDVGILVQHSDAEQIAGAIVSMASDEHRRLELGRRASERISESFNVVKTAEALYALMERPNDQYLTGS